MDATLDISLDRDADVPVGTQLAWALRSGILGGELAPGARLPPLQRLAASVGVNVNTIRAVYRRLEDSGLVVTRHGSGTYVTGASADPVALARLLAAVRQGAHDAGIDPRDVAAALYVGGESAPPDAEAEERRRMRAQIAALEQTLSELAGRRPGLLPRADEPPPRHQPGPRLLGLHGLTEQRDALVRRLAEVQQALAD